MRTRTCSSARASRAGAPSPRWFALAAAERTQELARMLSGVEVTRQALGAAEALAQAARPKCPPGRAA